VSRIRLYVDEDAMDGDLVRGLRSRGLDVVTAIDARMVCRPDEEHLSWQRRKTGFVFMRRLFPPLIPVQNMHNPDLLQLRRR
jgi:hypothetical protein